MPKVIDQGKVVIDLEEYKDLLADRKWLRALEAAGVDNWDGCSYAYGMFSSEDDED